MPDEEIIDNVLEDDNSENEQVLHQLSAQYDMMP
jgi:hypothetical protein